MYGETNLPSCVVIDLIRRTRKKDFTCFLVVEHDEEMGFYDPWGNSYQLVFYDDAEPLRSGTRRRMRVVVYSSGPNGKFEEGSGDDLHGRGSEVFVEPKGGMPE